MITHNVIFSRVTKYLEETQQKQSNTRQAFQREHAKELLWALGDSEKIEEIEFSRYEAHLSDKLYYGSDTGIISSSGFGIDVITEQGELLDLSPTQQQTLLDILRRAAEMWNGYIFEGDMYWGSAENAQWIIQEHPKYKLIRFSEDSSWQEGMKDWIAARNPKDAKSHFSSLLREEKHRATWITAIRFYRGSSRFLEDLFSAEEFAEENWNIPRQKECCKELWEEAISLFPCSLTEDSPVLQQGKEQDWVESLFAGCSVQESQERYQTYRLAVEQAEKHYNCRKFLRYLPTLSYYEPTGIWSTWNKVSDDFCITSIEFFDQDSVLLGTIIEDPDGNAEIYIGSSVVPTGSLMNLGPQRIQLHYTQAEREQFSTDSSYAIPQERSIFQLERSFSQTEWKLATQLMMSMDPQFKKQGIELLVSLATNSLELYNAINAWIEHNIIDNNSIQAHQHSIIRNGLGLDADSFETLRTEMEQLPPPTSI